MIRFITAYIALFLPVVGLATDGMVLPNSEILGTSAGAVSRLLTTNSSGTNLFPKEVRVIVANGVVDEVQAFYTDEVEIEQIAAAIETLYKNSEMTDLRRKNFRLWKIAEKRFVIQLSDYEGDRLLILTRMKESKGTGAGP